MAHDRLILNGIAMGLLGAGAILTTILEPGSVLNGALWGALITWFAAARVNGKNSTSLGSGSG